MKSFNKNKALRKLNFDKNKNTYIKRLSITLSCLILFCVIILFTFAKFESNSNEYTLMHGRIGSLYGDVNITGIYVDNALVDYAPVKDTGYIFDHVDCTNGTATWDNNYWGFFVQFDSQTKCDVYFNKLRDYVFEYTGDVQSFTPLFNGDYQIELWGAEGGKSLCNGSACTAGGTGAYTKGTITLSTTDTLYLYIGGKGTNGVKSKNGAGGWNGGGIGTQDQKDDETAGAGGGATDVRLTNGTWNDFDSLKSRIMVAAGGAGSAWYEAGGAGGGLTGYKHNLSAASIATQTTGYSFGVGQSGTTTPNPKGDGSDGVGGGSGGYYGGYATSTYTQNVYYESASSGTSFISGYSGCDAISSSSTSSSIVHTNQPNHYSGKVFRDAVMIDGNGCNWSTGVATDCGSNQPQPDGTLATGRTGNGYIKITYIS